jgi:hypothetical protein
MILFLKFCFGLKALILVVRSFDQKLNSFKVNNYLNSFEQNAAAFSYKTYLRAKAKPF